VTTEVSGVDLVRQALLAAREQAKKNGTAVKKKPKRRARRAVRRDGREPLGLGEAIGMMMTERGLTVPAAGGSVLARWDNILAAAAAELVGHVQAVKFDSDTGRLGVVPDSPAYGTKLRWSAQALVAAANADVPDANVRALHILPPAAATVGPTTAAADTAADAAAEPAGPVRTREDASTGYRPGARRPPGRHGRQGDRLPPRCAPRSSGRTRCCAPAARPKAHSTTVGPPLSSCARPARDGVTGPFPGPGTAAAGRSQDGDTLS
jgi:hypothetical protein